MDKQFYRLKVDNIFIWGRSGETERITMRRRSCGWNGLKHGYTLGARGGSTREVDLESVVGRLRAIFYGEEGEKGETVEQKEKGSLPGGFAPCGASTMAAISLKGR